MKVALDNGCILSVHRACVLTRRVLVIDLGTVDKKMLERFLVRKDGLVRESLEMDSVVLERKVCAFLGQDGLDFLGVFVNRLAHHLYTEIVRALAVVAPVQIVMSVNPVEVHFHQELGQTLDLPLAGHKYCNTLGIEKCLDTQRFHLTPTCTEHDVQCLQN